MPQLFDLPLELRELIYMSLITWERPQSHFESAPVATSFRHDIGPRWVGFGSDAVLQRPTSTCAAILAATKQLNREMTLTLDRARRAGWLVARIECVPNGDVSQFTWLSLPLVHSTRRMTTEKVVVVDSWITDVPVLGKLLGAANPHTRIVRATTRIEHLHIDIRLSETDIDRARSSSRGRSIGRHICAALAQVCEFQVQGEKPTMWRNSVTVDCLTLDVISPATTSPPTTNTAGGELDKSKQKALQKIANEIGNVWMELWASEDWVAKHYGQSLLECIKKVCVRLDGGLVRGRELGVELERGRKESERIARRAGW